jgi:hypothetical protein
MPGSRDRGRRSRRPWRQAHQSWRLAAQDAHRRQRSPPGIGRGSPCTAVPRLPRHTHRASSGSPRSSYRLLDGPHKRLRGLEPPTGHPGAPRRRRIVGVFAHGHRIPEDAAERGRIPLPTDNQQPVQRALDTRMTPCPTGTGRADTRRQPCANGRLDTRIIRPIRTGVVTGCRHVDPGGRQTLDHRGQVRPCCLHWSTFRVCCQVDDPPQPGDAHPCGPTCPDHGPAIVIVTAPHSLDAIPRSRSARILRLGAPIAWAVTTSMPGLHHPAVIAALMGRSQYSRRMTPPVAPAPRPVWGAACGGGVAARPAERGRHGRWPGPLHARHLHAAVSPVRPARRGAHSVRRGGGDRVSTAPRAAVAPRLRPSGWDPPASLWRP